MEGFKPFGINKNKPQIVKLTFEEYESIRLIHYEKLTQEQAAKHMNISRPTFTRIHNKALANIAQAFIEGKVIKISGGRYYIEGEWYKCKKCSKLIEGIENHVQCYNCKKFGDNELIKFNSKKN